MRTVEKKSAFNNGGGRCEIIIVLIIIEESQGVVVIMVVQPPIICVSTMYLRWEKSLGPFSLFSSELVMQLFLLQN